VVQLSNGSAPKIEQGSSNRNKVKQVKGKKISHLAESAAHQYVERSSRCKQNAARSPLGPGRHGGASSKRSPSAALVALDPAS
jgi:hypothetical protein